VSNFDAIPAELRELPRWVVWRWGEIDPKTGKRKKPPFRADAPGLHASSTHKATWGTFAQALKPLENGRADGIGFALCPPYVGIDLDEELSEANQSAIIGTLDSYTERSVSGTGWHVVIRASLNGRGRHPAGVGIFQTDRFFYFSGEHARGTPTTIEDRQAELDRVLEEFLPPKDEGMPSFPVQPVDIDDQELIDRAMGARNGADFQRLWNGDTGGYRSPSEADLALCNMLAFWTGRDPGRIDQLFRSSGLMRDKWLRDDYRERTIEAAIAATTEVFQPSARKRVPTSNPSKPLYLEQRGVRTDFAGGCDLEAVLGAFGELLVMPDPGAVEIALASIVANYAQGDAVWPLLVGPPGCGKSEIVSALKDAPCVWPLSSLTPQTLLSGFERKGKDNRGPASMLIQIGSFGIIAFKDLTTVLTMHHEARSQIFGQLREVADGRTEKSFGNGLRVEWEGKLGLIAGVTPVIDEQHSFLSVMGERFLLYRLPEVTRREIAARSLKRRGHEEELRERIRTMVAEFLGRFRGVGQLELPEHFTEPLITLADIVTRARSAVARDRQTRDILYLPEPEAPTRLAKQVAQLMAAALAIGVDETEAWRLAQKIGWDSVPAVRSAVIRLLSRHEEELPRAELPEKTGLPETTARRVVEDLVVLGIVTQRKDSGKWLITQSPAAADYWSSVR
jgi:putative DNA primase/helicase